MAYIIARPEIPNAIHPGSCQGGGGGLGRVSLIWGVETRNGVKTKIEIRVGSPTGAFYTAAESPPTGGAIQGTGDTGWIADGTTYFLQDITDGRPGVTLGWVKVRVACGGPSSEWVTPEMAMKAAAYGPSFAADTNVFPQATIDRILLSQRTPGGGGISGGAGVPNSGGGGGGGGVPYQSPATIQGGGGGRGESWADSLNESIPGASALFSVGNTPGGPLLLIVGAALLFFVLRGKD